MAAFWETSPDLNERDPRPIETTAALREVAQHFNEALAREGIKPIRLGMGLHHGWITTAQDLTVGDAFEVAARIQQFTEQLGTDLIITGAAAPVLKTASPLERITSADESTPELFELTQASSASSEAA